jgi:hypothetical protein
VDCIAIRATAVLNAAIGFYHEIDMSKITKTTALGILDSRGNPTISVSVTLNTGVTATASVPLGASTGIREAVELRDGDAERYGGKGVLQAVGNFNKAIAPKLKARSPHTQRGIDGFMRKLDGTVTKSKLGAHAILGASMAVRHAAALDSGLPLYTYVRKLQGGEARASYALSGETIQCAWALMQVVMLRSWAGGPAATRARRPSPRPHAAPTARSASHGSWLVRCRCRAGRQP